MAISEIQKKIRRFFREINAVQVETQADPVIERVAEAVAFALRTGHKILICGNGGSFAEALHFGGELVGKFKKERRALPAIVLGANPSALTAVSNDYDYSSAFKREVEAYGNPGDLLIVLSTSGNSKNLVEAVNFANEHDIFTIGFLGSGGTLSNMVAIPLMVKSASTPRIQEMHLVFVHIISELVEELLFGDGK